MFEQSTQIYVPRIDESIMVGESVQKKKMMVGVGSRELFRATRGMHRTSISPVDPVGDRSPSIHVVQRLVDSG